MFGECSELQGVEGVPPTSDVLHRVFSAAAIAGGGGATGDDDENVTSADSF